MSKFGLPLEYQELSEYFDSHDADENHKARNTLVENLLRKHNVRTVLDMTCGTGSQVLYLAKHGYNVTGSDFSPALLDIARNKAKKANLDLQFIDGDMRKVRVGKNEEKFDAVITIHNAIGHLTKPDFEKAIRNIGSNLKDNGLYIFDIFNLEAMSDQAVIDLAWYSRKKFENSQMQSIQCSTLDRENGILTSYDSYLIQKNVEKPQRFINEFSLQIYTSQELQDMLLRNGFEIIEYHDFDGSAFVRDKTVSMLIVARRNS